MMMIMMMCSCWLFWVESSLGSEKPSYVLYIIIISTLHPFLDYVHTYTYIYACVELCVDYFLRVASTLVRAGDGIGAIPNGTWWLFLDSYNHRWYCVAQNALEMEQASLREKRSQKKRFLRRSLPD
jgi:hypothetical protein